MDLLSCWTNLRIHCDWPLDYYKAVVGKSQPPQDAKRFETNNMRRCGDQASGQTEVTFDFCLTIRLIGIGLAFLT